MAQVKCPQCGRYAEYVGNENRPFCSERCKLIDLGAWIEEEHAIAGGTTELEDLALTLDILEDMEEE